MPRERTYRAEYARRIARAQAEGLPTSVGRGHGPVPKRIAKALERQRDGGRALPVRTQTRYRRGIGVYEKTNWGSLVTGRVLGVRRTDRLVPRRFADRAQAGEFLEEQGLPSIDSDYVEVSQLGTGAWVIRLLR